MSRFARSTALMLLAAAIAGCATTPRVSPATEEAAIRDLTQQWLRAVAAKDVATIAGFYAMDANQMTPNGPPFVGVAAIRNGWDELLHRPNVSLTFAPTSVRVANSGELASEVGSYQLSFTTPDGPVRDEGTFASTWQKMGGQWKVVSEVVTSSKPLPAPMMNVMVMETAPMQMMGSAGMQWTDLSVPGFAPGMKMAPVHGDPNGKGDYTLRLRFPDGYEFPAHYHPNAEHVTVLSGSFTLGMGSRTDRSALRTYGPGDFIYIPGKNPHFGGARGETVIQLHGIGPFEIKLASATP